MTSSTILVGHRLYHDLRGNKLSLPTYIVQSHTLKIFKCSKPFSTHWWSAALKIDHLRVIDVSFIFQYQNKLDSYNAGLNNLCEVCHEHFLNCKLWRLLWFIMDGENLDSISLSSYNCILSSWHWGKHEFSLMIWLSEGFNFNKTAFLMDAWMCTHIFSAYFYLSCMHHLFLSCYAIPVDLGRFSNTSVKDCQNEINIKFLILEELMVASGIERITHPHN